MTDDKKQQEFAKVFDVQYLRSLYDEMNGSLKEQGRTLSGIKETLATQTQILKNMEKKNEEQDKVLGEHGMRIHRVEMAQAGCSWGSDRKGIWSNIKRFNAFMDLYKKKSGDIDTQAVDVHAQRMQHAAEAAMGHDVPFRAALLKLLPWIIVTIIFSVVLTTLILAQTVTGKPVLLPEPPAVPAIELKTNSSSQGGGK